jgi:hypothetical protein
MNNKSKWLIVCLYAVAMAWVESAVVYYLRTMLGRIDPHQFYPLPIIGGLGKAELVREAATLLMLLAVGALAGTNTRSRMGYFAVGFGIWDIFYYIFLKVMCGWPHSLFDWDILFLLPLPWWGPVLAPVSIAVLMILWGTFASSWHVSLPHDRPLTFAWMMNGIGALICLYAFMVDSLKVAGEGTEVLRYVLPTYFNWPLFCIGLAFMAAPVAQTGYYLMKYSGGAGRRLDLTRWIQHFARNKENRMEPDWNQPWTFPLAALAPLRRSIEQFQL